MKHTSKLTIIIPARKEEDTIIETLERIRREVKISYHIIVVNDFSNPTDTTADIVKRYQNKHQNVTVVVHRPDNPDNGFASAIARGIEEAPSGYVVFVMADNCDDLHSIRDMYLTMGSGWDAVCGSRYSSSGSRHGGPLAQNLFSRLVNHTLSFLIAFPTRDITNAFKMYKKEWAIRAVSPIRGGVEYSMEMILRAHFLGARIAEVPTSWQGRVRGRSKFKILERAPRYLRIYLWALGRFFLSRV